MSRNSIIGVKPSALKAMQKILACGRSLYLRVGVRQGGCSGLSYTMDKEDYRSVTNKDEVVYSSSNITIVCDPKSLLYLYGMSLDYEDALIGGGFVFFNPNASQTCGCGKSFRV